MQLTDVWAGGDIDTAPPTEAVRIAWAGIIEVPTHALEKIALSQHAGAQWLPAASIRFTGTHPHIYAAFNSHANYAVEGTHKNKDDAFAFVSRISPLLTLGAVQWIQIADVVDLQSDLFTYEEPRGKRYQRFITWRTWDEGIWDWTDRADWGECGRFSGFWGAEVDQTFIDEPPLGVTAGPQLHAATLVGIGLYVREHRCANLMNMSSLGRATHGPPQEVRAQARKRSQGTPTTSNVVYTRQSTIYIASQMIFPSAYLINPLLYVANVMNVYSIVP